MSFAPGSEGGQLVVLNAVVLTAAGFCAAYWRSGLPLIAGVGIAVALGCFRLHQQPLFALSSAQVAQARKAEGWGFVLLVILGFF